MFLSKISIISVTMLLRVTGDQFAPSSCSWNSSGYFLNICSQILVFGSQVGVMILVKSKQKVERKSEWFRGVKFFNSSF